MHHLRLAVSVIKKLLLAFAALVCAVLFIRMLVVPGLQAVFDPGDAAMSLVRRIGIFVFAVLAYWTYVRLGEGRRAEEVRPAPLPIALGAASGSALIALPMLALFAMGAYTVTATQGLQSGLLGMAGLIVIAATLEEIAYRCILFRIIENAWGTLPALGLQSVIFGLGHLENLEGRAGTAELITMVASVTLVGALWTLVFVHTRNLWATAANHAAWNFTIVLSGLPLSGIEDWRTTAPLISEYRGPVWLTGGLFGPESSVVTIVLLAVSVAALLYWARRKHRLVAGAAWLVDAPAPLQLNPVMPRSLSPRAIAAALTEHWSPRVIAELDQNYVKVAKVQGTIGWHSHAGEDELFLILKGRLRIDTETGPVTLEEGELYVVPAGMQHNPSAEEECLLMLIEKKSTLHTGTVVNEKTRSLAEQLRPV